jgi:hypothetical protein
MFSQPNVVGSGRWYVSFYSHVLYCFSGSLAFVSNFKALFSQVRPKMGSYSAVASETLILQCSTCPSAVDWLASIHSHRGKKRIALLKTRGNSDDQV